MGPLGVSLSVKYKVKEEWRGGGAEREKKKEKKRENESLDVTRCTGHQTLLATIIYAFVNESLEAHIQHEIFIMLHSASRSHAEDE